MLRDKRCLTGGRTTGASAHWSEGNTLSQVIQTFWSITFFAQSTSAMRLRLAAVMGSCINMRGANGLETPAIDTARAFQLRDLNSLTIHCVSGTSIDGAVTHSAQDQENLKQVAMCLAAGA